VKSGEIRYAHGTGEQVPIDPDLIKPAGQPLVARSYTPVRGSYQRSSVERSAPSSPDERGRHLPAY
jgi:hypothetical protein